MARTLFCQSFMFRKAPLQGGSKQALDLITQQVRFTLAFGRARRTHRGITRAMIARCSSRVVTWVNHTYAEPSTWQPPQPASTRPTGFGHSRAEGLEAFVARMGDNSIARFKV